ncbi:hypothetical protein niasHT_009943 [Heterodera trifolii]|uniref:Uncharacterized protein n=1 Tax=Heterodera trifolii TaxID=157864 RepID=A0ABD2MDB9_9BILA
MDTKVTKYSPTLKYEFNPNEKPTVGQAINSLLPTNFGMPLAQAMAQFDLKVQIRERATESALNTTEPGKK